MCSQLLSYYTANEEYEYSNCRIIFCECIKQCGFRVIQGMDTHAVIGG